jgi:molecular chaperone GrpE
MEEKNEKQIQEETQKPEQNETQAQEGNENEETQKENELISQIEDLESKLREYEDLVKRKVADFENFRKRTLQEKQQTGEMASEKVIVNFLPVLDNLERAIESAEENQDFQGFLEGIHSIRNIFKSVLDQYSVEQIDSVGKEFDPKIHHALYTVEGDYEKQTVIQEVEKAFMRKGKAIRTAKVAVGVPKKEEAKKEEEQ